MSKQMIYEVETRVYFKDEIEAFNKLPFLKECLNKQTGFETNMYGIDLFNSGKILRISTVTHQKGYKEPDQGRIYNIRNEIDEEITNGIDDSIILNKLTNQKMGVNRENIDLLLESLGYKHFMKLIGINKIGYLESHSIDLKLMFCPLLKYPVLLEIEMTAENLEDASSKELEIMNFIEYYQLEDRVLREEPPMLFNGMLN